MGYVHLRKSLSLRPLHPFDLTSSQVQSISTLAIQDFIQRRSILAEPPDTDISSESHQQNPLESEVTAPCPVLQDSHTENSETSATAAQPILPTQINLGQYQAQLRTLHQPNLDPKLYGLDISGHTEIKSKYRFSDPQRPTRSLLGLSHLFGRTDPSARRVY